LLDAGNAGCGLFPGLPSLSRVTSLVCRWVDGRRRLLAVAGTSCLGVDVGVKKFCLMPGLYRLHARCGPVDLRFWFMCALRTPVLIAIVWGMQCGWIRWR